MKTDDTIGLLIEACREAHELMRGDGEPETNYTMQLLTAAIERGTKLQHRKLIIESMVAAYNAGVHCAKVVNSRDWSVTQAKKERAGLNSILRKFGLDPLTEEEYAPFND